MFLLTLFVELSHKSQYSKVHNCFKNRSPDPKMKALQTLAGTSFHQKKKDITEVINKGWCINGVQGNLFPHICHLFVSLFNNSDHQIQSKLSLWQLPSSGWTWGKRIHFSLYKVPKKLECQPISVQVCFLAECLDSVSVHLRQASERPITIDNPWLVHQWRSNGHWVESSVGERNVPSHVSLHQTNQLSVILVPCLCQYTWVGHGLEAGI